MGHSGYGAHTIGNSGYGAWQVWGMAGLGHGGYACGGAYSVDSLEAKTLFQPLRAYSDISFSSLLCTAIIPAISFNPIIIRITNYFHHKINCEIFVTDRVRDHLTKL